MRYGLCSIDVGLISGYVHKGYGLWKITKKSGMQGMDVGKTLLFMILPAMGRMRFAFWRPQLERLKEQD